MGSAEELMQLCRLCMDKNSVNVPIFPVASDNKETYEKISSCLPVKVTPNDRLPKKICDGCSSKLDILYLFRKQSSESEQQLVKLLTQVGIDVHGTHDLAKPEVSVKQEAFEHVEVRNDPLEDSAALDPAYLVPEQSMCFDTSFPSFGEPTSSATNNGPPAKRAKRAAAMKKPIVEEIETEENLLTAKAEGDSDDDDSENVDQPDYVEAPSTSADDQPGPSGVNAAVEAPFDEEQNMCLLCNKTYDTRRQFLVHKRRVHSQKIYACPICDRKFNIRGTWKNHMDLHAPEKKYHCVECDLKFQTYCLWNRHKREHHDGKEYTCKECGYKTLSSNDSVRHLREHATQMFTCEYCGKGFRLKGNMKQHLKVHGVGPNIKVSCHLCEKVFVKKFSLKLHISKFHEGKRELPELCEICGKEITTKKGLVEHMRVHKGDKKHCCEYCGKSFVKKGTLRMHLSVHTKEKPHACKLCEKRYTQRTSLVIHMRSVHTGIRPYACQICDKRFVSGDQLKNHLRSHPVE